MSFGDLLVSLTSFVGLNDNLSLKLLFAKYFIQYFSNISDFGVVNRHCENAVFNQKISRYLYPRVYHVKPMGVKSSGCFCI